MKNLSLELNRILTLMEVKGDSNLPLLVESEQMILNVVDKLDEKTKLEIQKTTSDLFDDVMKRVKECYNPNDYPELYKLAYTSLCAVIIICIIISTEGLAVVDIMAIAYGLQCSMELVKQYLALDKNTFAYKRLKKEYKRLSKCANQDFPILTKKFSESVTTSPEGMIRTIKDIFGL